MRDRLHQHYNVTIPIVVVRETEGAILVYQDGNKVWIPKKLCQCDGDVITLPKWLANEKGLKDERERNKQADRRKHQNGAREGRNESG